MAFSGVFTMPFALMSVTVLHLVTLTMLFIATLEKSWWTWGDAENTDLWHKCMYDNSTDTWLCTSAKENEWLHSVQAFVVVAVILSSISFLVFLCELFTRSNKGLFCFTGLCQIFAGLAVFAAVLIYSFQKKEILQDPRELSLGHFGYCFVLAWVCVPLLFSIGVFHVHLRKRS